MSKTVSVPRMMSLLELVGHLDLCIYMLSNIFKTHLVILIYLIFF